MFQLFKKRQTDTQIHATNSGVLMSISKLEDGVFSEFLLGDGFYIFPQSGDIFSPVDGRVDSIFPTKHAISIKSMADDNIILHMGIDTVELEGVPFTLFVKAGDKIKAGQKVARVDLAYLDERNIGSAIITVFPESKKKLEMQRINVEVREGEVVGRMV